ncbi:MAG: hypothetical protein AB2552_17530 [Candidatus Thiodiazotropha endolucinida]
MTWNVLKIIKDNKVFLKAFEERDDAIAHIEYLLNDYTNHGYNEEHGYWWGRNSSDPSENEKFITEI